VAVSYTDRDAVRELLARDGGSVSPGQGTAASLPDETFDSAIVRASARVDSMLGAVYTVPFVAPPATPVMVVDITEAIAAYDVDRTFREVRDYQSELNPVYLRYKEAMALLGQLQKGLATLPDYVPPDPDPGSVDPPGGSIGSVINPLVCVAEVYPNRPRGWMSDYYGWTL
jgi:phage gp36-like protein